MSRLFWLMFCMWFSPLFHVLGRFLLPAIFMTFSFSETWSWKFNFFSRMYQGTNLNYMYLVVLFYGCNGVNHRNVFLFQVLDEKITYAKHKIQLSEIEKSGGVLSNLVLFLKKTSLPKEIVSTITSRDVTMYSEVNFMWTPGWSLFSIL